MIDNIRGQYFLECDGCGLRVNVDSFGEAVDYKMENGWKSIKTGINNDDWAEYCPDCKKEFNNER